MHTIDIFRIINGLYRSTDLVTTLEIEDVFQSDEIDEFCQENGCYYTDNSDDILFCNKTKQPKFWLK